MKKAVIIGAGPAGVTAAYELLKKSDEYEVLILEESQEIGGISRTVRYNGNRMDIGGHRFFSKDDRVTAWWATRLCRSRARRPTTIRCWGTYDSAEGGRTGSGEGRPGYADT